MITHVFVSIFCCFFFKQKTAYEMRISDWSSDVCSSDLVSGACFSDFGHEVVCVDKDAEKVHRLRALEMPIYEPGLEALVADNAEAGRLAFTTDLAEAVAGADAVFIAVGTPSRRGNGFADLSYVYAAAEEIADALADYTVIVTKSTVPVGTGAEVERIIRDRRPDAAFDVASNPEFLREGAAIELGSATV